MVEPKREVVAITGASAGLGRAIAREFAKRGACVGLIARGIDGLTAAQREVESLGGRALVAPADVADADAVDACASQIEAAFGPIDVWVNNAMASVFSPVHEMTAADYRRVTEVTYLGYVHGTLAALKRMRLRNCGAIVQVGSALAYRAIPLQSAYCAAKFAIRGFTDALRTELEHDRSGIHICMVQMPAMNTPQFSWVKTRLPHKPQPVPPIYQPEVAARAVVWAAHHRRREIYVAPSTVGAIVANKIMPGWLDRYLARTGYSAQQYDGAPVPGRRDNLWEPVPGDHGAHGDFDAHARPFSMQSWANLHRAWLAAGAGAALIAYAARRGSKRS